MLYYTTGAHTVIERNFSAITPALQHSIKVFGYFVSCQLLGISNLRMFLPTRACVGIRGYVPSALVIE